MPLGSGNVDGAGEPVGAFPSPLVIAHRLGCASTGTCEKQDQEQVKGFQPVEGR